MKDLPIVPGRGLTTQKAIDLRLEYLNHQAFDIPEISKHHLDIDEIKYNIESFIGSVEIPTALVGPLLFNDENNSELVYCAAGTLEGALIASMNRGAKAISQSGGFESAVLYQKMTRSPLFILSNLREAIIFDKWVKQHFVEIKAVAESYSNHAHLSEISSALIGKSVHLTFSYQTGDASGQNMTTSCTWHAMIWIVEHFVKATKFSIEDFLIEGNGASDKKISHSNMLNGRGVHVVAECFLTEEVIQRVLRTSSHEIVKCFNSSLLLSKMNGMTGFNINTANTLAAIFVATGQDLASIAESSNALLNVEKVETGLYLSLNFPNLVIGTVGGGTHLKKQCEALELMSCYGSGKVNRFARLIAGFALSLEISTYSAIVSGEFAKAHEKLGRNKPVNWLLKSEITKDFVLEILKKNIEKDRITAVEIGDSKFVDIGIITNITNRVSKKLIGFIPIQIKTSDKENKNTHKILLKSKALDTEVIKGLHTMAASIDTSLSDLINKYQNKLEYNKCHLKELEIYANLAANGFDCTPLYYGKYIDKKREIFLLAIEFLPTETLTHFNSENKPQLWQAEQIKEVISSITKVHRHYELAQNRENLPSVKEFKVWESVELYKKLTRITYHEEENLILKADLLTMLDYIDDLQMERERLKLPKTLIHNDFNPRNICLRADGQVCIYDWELVTIGISHRDVVEFLSFVLSEGFSKNEFFNYLEFHFSLYANIEISWSDWIEGYIYSIKEYLTSRVSFYATAGILIKYKFTDRVLKNCFRMLSFLK